jgi:hypothetical protein
VNALYGLAASSTRIAGPALGGLFVALAGPGVVVAAGAAVSGTFAGTAMQQQVPPDKLARVSSLSLFPSSGTGVIGYIIDGPLAAAIGPAAVFGVGAVYGLLGSAVVLALPSIRAVTRAEKDLSASAPPRAARRRRPAAPPP